MATRHQVRQAVVSLLYAREMGSCGEEFVEGEDCRLQVQADFVCYARFLPSLSRVFGVGGVDVAGGDAAVFGQGEGDGGAAVTGENADFQIVFRVCEPNEPSQNGRLLGSDGHFAHTVLRGAFAQAGEGGVFGGVDAAQVGEKPGCGGGGADAHAAGLVVGIIGVGFFRHFGGGKVFFFLGIEFDIP